MIAVVGAGAVGLAIAEALARSDEEVVVLERHRRAGQETSTHNSGVIHAGLYYPRGTLKARLCVEGRDRLYAFCREHAVPHRRAGKLIVAGDEHERADLERLADNAAACGARLEWLGPSETREREPHVRAHSALWSPDTGWLNAEAYVRALERQAASRGAILLPGSPLVGCETIGDRLRLRTPHESIDADLVVNAAGLYADEVSRRCGGEAFTIYPCRGEYATLTPRASALVRGLVYPVPHASGHGLGVHLTKTIDGEVWIGPTIRYQDRKDDYESDRLPVDAYLEPTRHLLPAITIDDLRLGGSGIRAKLHPPSERFADFLIRRDAQQPRLVQAAGIDSPGLTASLAIGALVAAIARDGA